LKLSLSRKGVAEERYVTIGGTPGLSDRLVLTKNSDFGSNYAGTSGAIGRTVYNETPLDHWTSEVIWGCKTESPSGTDIYVLQTFSDAFNIGSLTTQRIYSEEIEESWNALKAYIDGLEIEDEKIIVKIQTEHQEPSIVLHGVWANGNTIHLNDTDEYVAWLDIEAGNEIVIVNGLGQGQSCHVTEDGVDDSSATMVTFKVDEEIGTANSVVEFYFTNFKKCGGDKTREKQDVTEFIKAEIENAKSPWVMIKLEFRGFNIALNVVDLSSSAQKSSFENVQSEL
jgi:hypothetical protein